MDLDPTQQYWRGWGLWSGAMLVALYFVVKLAVVAAKRTLDSGELLTRAELVIVLLTLVFAAVMMKVGWR